MNVDASRRGRFRRTASLLLIAGFVMLTFCARWSEIEAQSGTKKKKKSQPLTPVRAAADTGSKAKLDGAHSLTAGKQVDALALAKVIDDELLRRLRGEKITPAPLADDAEFLRRVYLDLVGVIPPAEKVKAFLASKDVNKRAKVIDELLADPRFGSYVAERWASLMVPRESNNRQLNVEPLKSWLAAAFNKNQPLNKLVYELITATGNQEQNGAVTYFIGNNTVDKITDNVTRMFLGVQLQCAQCHNHPFTDYKQNEYWAMAAFFLKTRVSANPQQAAKKGIAIEVTENSKAPQKKKKGLPDSVKIVPAKFLRGEAPSIGPRDPSRPVLAHWMTSDTNPYFARAMANRFWYQLFGRGMVNPVDDMHADNTPVLPEILATLAEQLRLNHYDAKYLVRALCNSAAYQRTSRTGAKGGPADPDLYSVRPVRVMSPEQLYDSVTQVIGALPAKGKGAGGIAKKKGGGGTPRQQFVNFFHVEGGNPLEYQTGIPQALRLMNSVQMNRTEPIVASAMRGGKAPGEVIEHLYLMTVSRPPVPEERQRLAAYITKQSTPQRGYGDILWALLNSSEFVTNH